METEKHQFSLNSHLTERRRERKRKGQWPEQTHNGNQEKKCNNKFSLIRMHYHITLICFINAVKVKQKWSDILVNTLQSFKLTFSHLSISFLKVGAFFTAACVASFFYSGKQTCQHFALFARSIRRVFSTLGDLFIDRHNGPPFQLH